MKLGTERAIVLPLSISPKTKVIRTLECLRLKNIPRVAGNRAKVGQNHAARKAVSVTFLVLK